MECYHESRRICRLADWLPRMPPCPAMKSRGSIRVEVHVAGGTVQYWTVAMGVWRMRWYLTIHVRNAGMHVKLPDRGGSVRMRVLMRTCMPMLTPTYIQYKPTHCALSAKDRTAMQCSATAAWSECRRSMLDRQTAERQSLCCLSHVETCKCGGRLRL